MFVGIDAQLCHSEGAALGHLARCPAAAQDGHMPTPPTREPVLTSGWVPSPLAAFCLDFFLQVFTLGKETRAF
jgi:hypothetical protein